MANHRGYCGSERRVGLEYYSVYHQTFELQGTEAYVDRRAIEDSANELISTLATSNFETIKNPTTYYDDARTLLFEALTASGHLSLVEIHGKDLMDINSQVLGVLLNGWNDNLPEAEKYRRFMEICEELTIQEIQWQILAGILPSDTLISTISDYPDALEAGAAHKIGYRPQNRKGMVRTIGLKFNEDDTLTRTSEQISRSNASAAESAQYLQGRNISLVPGPTADARVLGTQLVSWKHEMEEGVIGLQKSLDRAKGKHIRHGENHSPNQIPYSLLREESRRREDAAECYIQLLADFTQHLDVRRENGEISEYQYMQLLKTEVRDILRAICTMDPSYAADCFGQDSVATYIEASNRMALGDVAGAQGVIFAYAHLETPPSGCGMSIDPDQKNDSNGPSLSNKLQLGAESWKWSKGKCRIEACPTRPDTTDIGPCSICKMCQRHFDDGNDPRQVYRRRGYKDDNENKKTKHRLKPGAAKSLKEKQAYRPAHSPRSFGRYALGRETIKA